jgi:hypothetical protein
VHIPFSNNNNNSLIVMQRLCKTSLHMYSIKLYHSVTFYMLVSKISQQITTCWYLIKRTQFEREKSISSIPLSPSTILLSSKQARCRHGWLWCDTTSLSHLSKNPFLLVFDTLVNCGSDDVVILMTVVLLFPTMAV